jgi:mono/diheme cytochrome c family protein
MRTALKWAGIVVGALVVILLIGGFVASRVGAANIAEVHDVPVATLTIPTDSAALARGAHLAGIYGCQDCHGADLSGQVMADEGPARIVASNLTPAGIGGEYEPEDWDRAIRHGVGIDGTALFVMPSGAYHSVSDTEAADLIAYLEALPPVENDLPPMEYTLLGRLLAAGPLDLSKGVYPDPTPTSSPAPGATVEYGEYLARGMCAYCHGEGLVGKEADQPGAPPAPNLVASGQWTPEEFHQALTTGITPTGHEMNPEFMPWTATAKMTHDEREGLRLYLATLADRRTADA